MGLGRDPFAPIGVALNPIDQGRWIRKEVVDGGLFAFGAL